MLLSLNWTHLFKNRKSYCRFLPELISPNFCHSILQICQLSFCLPRSHIRFLCGAWHVLRTGRLQLHKRLTCRVSLGLMGGCLLDVVNGVRTYNVINKISLNLIEIKFNRSHETQNNNAKIETKLKWYPRRLHCLSQYHSSHCCSRRWRHARGDQ